MSRDTDDFGERGEAVASAVLARKGYRIIERNYRSRWGELDVVAYDGATLVFIEVKSRRGSRFGEPVYAIDQRKRARLVRMAQQYLVSRRLGEPLCRFDIVVVDERGPGPPRVDVIPNAFDASPG